MYFLTQVQYGYDQAKADKERAELEVMKLNRELEKLQYQVLSASIITGYLLLVSVPGTYR
jgi:hypothetical protein